jgi:hypothetical protein
MNRRTVSRRTAVAGGLATSIVTAAVIYAQGDFPTPAPVAIGTPHATPIADLPHYDGDLAALWDTPWDVEGKLLSIDGIIEMRQDAPPGQGIPVGDDGDVYLRVLYLKVPDLSRWVFVATNADLSRIDDLHTAHVEGVYAGLHGPGWKEPLIIANVVEPVTS